MKLYGIILYTQQGTQVKLVGTATDVSSFGYFERSSAREFMHFFAKTLTERTAPGTRQAVTEQNYVFYIHSRHDGFAGVTITDASYDQRVAFSLITKSLELFMAKFTKDVIAKSTQRELPFPELDGMLTKYQNPVEADSMLKIQKDLDDTKVILHKTIETVLERGEKIDNLVERSNELSTSSKVFFTQAKKANSSCCVLQ